MIRKTTDYIIVHCSATPPDMDIGVEEIRKWHVEERGWKDIGYHDVIRRNGRRELGRPLFDTGAHTKGYNDISVGVCLVGGVDSDGHPENNFTEQQMEMLKKVIKDYKKVFPGVMVAGHRDFSDKDCPSFDVKEWLRNGF